MWAGAGDAKDIIAREGLKQISGDDALEAIAAQIIAAHPKQAEQYQGGKDKLLGFFVGQMMKETKGQANPAQSSEIMRRKLSQ